MKEYTNRHNLPEEVVRAITKDRYSNEEEAPSDYSATKLLAPVQQTVLMERYKDQLAVRDVVDDYWAFLGNIAHNVLEEAAASTGAMVEQRLYTHILGKTLSGKMDCYHNGEIRDYKSTKVYKIMKGNYDEWEKQLNIYAHISKENGLEVKSLKVVALLFDWKKQEVYKDNYPEAPVVVIPLRLWPDNLIGNYIQMRVASLEAAKACTDEELTAKYPCSMEEQWCDVKDYAVMKAGAARATKLFTNEEEAKEFQKTKGAEYQVIKRITERTRCYHWCDIAHLCPQHKRQCEEEGRPTENANEEGTLF